MLYFILFLLFMIIRYTEKMKWFRLCFAILFPEIETETGRRTKDCHDSPGYERQFRKQGHKMLEYYKSGYFNGLGRQWEIISEKYFQGNLINMVV